MSADESTSLEELFPLLLAACDDSQAVDAPLLSVPGGAVPPELRERLQEDANWCRRIRRLFRAPGTTLTHSPDPETTSSFLSPTINPGASFGRFQINRELGRGAYGVVFLAYDPSLGREVALKVPRPEALVSPELRARFRQEARAAAGLDHPNLVPVYEVGEEGPICYIASGYCPGITLSAWLKQRTEPVPYRQAAQVMATLAEAVAHAHERGVVHRDLKPGNVLLQSSGLIPKITDFGLAKLAEGNGADVSQTQTGAILGTPSYMAPEQAGAKKEIGPAADIYALGAILYELLTGRPPFVADSTLEMLVLVRNQEPLAPSRLRPKLPRDLETICLKCLQKEPGRRYSSARALANDLRHYLAGEPIQARPVGTVERWMKWTRRRPTVAALLVGLVMAVSAGLMASSILWLHAEGERGRAEMEKRQSQDRLVSLRVATGVRMMEEGDLYGSMLWFVKALEEEQGGPEREALHRTRIGCVLRQCPRLSLLLSHPAAVVDAQFSPDGSRIVTVCDGHGAQVWDAASGRALSPSFGNAGPYSRAAFSPDGRWIVMNGGDQTARVWVAPSGQPVSSPMRHTDTVRWAAFSPDGKRVVTASDDRTAQVWDAASGQPLSPPLGHADKVWQAAFSPDGQRVVTASFDRTARVWDALSGQSIYPPLKHPNIVYTAAFSGDGRWLVTCCAVQARVWDALTGQPLSPPLQHPGGNGTSIAAFSPDGKRVATASNDQTARVWDSVTGQPVGLPLHHTATVAGAIFSPDSRRLVTASLDQTARVWDVASGQPLCPPLKHAGVVTQALFSPDGRRVLTASGDHFVRLWDLASSQSVLPVLKHPRSLVRAVYSSDGEKIVTGSWDASARVWDGESGQPFSRPVRHAERITDVAFSPDGRWFVTGSEDQTARVWDAATGRPISPPLRHGAAVFRVVFCPDGSWVVTTGEGAAVRRWEALSGREVLPPLEEYAELPPDLIRHAAWSCAGWSYVAFDSDGRRLVTAGKDKRARLWDAASGRLLLPPLEHAGLVINAAFSPDGSTIFTASGDTSTRLWDAATGQLRCTLKHALQVNAAAFSPNGRQIVTASADQMAQVWDAVSGQPMSPPLKHGGQVRDAAFSPDGRWVVTASDDGMARVWEAASGQLLAPPLKHRPGAVRSAVFRPDGHRVLTASNDSTARIWDLSPEQRAVPDLIALATLLNDRRVDERGNETAVEPEALAGIFEQVQAKDPNSLLASAEHMRAWHREQAAAAERGGDWADALVHLDQIESVNSGGDDLGWRRARAYAGLGQWQKAREAFQRDYRDLPGVDEQPFGWHALVCAMVGDWEQEKRICALLLKEFTEPATAANNVAWYCGRFPNRVEDPGKVVALAEKALKDWQGDPTFRNTLGVALYRAGRYSEAIAELDQAVALGHGGGVFDWIFLAMAHQRLGHQEEAQKWLAKTRDLLNPKSGTSPLRWDERAELQLIRKEAEDPMRNP
jgi:WD40 repeat protein